jgi:hypothetical protein
MVTLFVSNRNMPSQTYQIRYPEVKTRTLKGYPVTYEMKSLPGDYPSWAEALEALNRLTISSSDYGQSGGLCPPSPY